MAAKVNQFEKFESDKVGIQENGAQQNNIQEKHFGEHLIDELDYNSIIGPNSPYIKLISSDYHEFIIERKYALLSDTMKSMLSQLTVGENKENFVYLKYIPHRTLRNICTYLQYTAPKNNEAGTNAEEPNLG